MSNENLGHRRRTTDDGRHGRDYKPGPVLFIIEGRGGLKKKVFIPQSSEYAAWKQNCLTNWSVSLTFADSHEV